MTESLTVAGMMHAQVEFEHERGLQALNTPAYGLRRMGDELEEAWEELLGGTNADLFYEVADVMIFATSVLYKLADNEGISYEEAGELIRRKMELNKVKYAHEFFNGGVSPSEGIVRARNFWAMPPINTGNDVY